jgi:hypothetical protein
MKALTPRIRLLSVVVVILATLTLILAFGPSSYTKLQENACQDPAIDCRSPKYLGKKQNCPCFACKKTKPEEPLRVVCTSDPQAALTLFLSEERDTIFITFTQNALDRATNIQAFKQNMIGMNLDPNEFTIINREVSPIPVFDPNRFVLLAPKVDASTNTNRRNNASANANKRNTNSSANSNNNRNDNQ